MVYSMTLSIKLNVLFSAVLEVLPELKKDEKFKMFCYDDNITKDDRYRDMKKVLRQKTSTLA